MDVHKGKSSKGIIHNICFQETKSDIINPEKFIAYRVTIK